MNKRRGSIERLGPALKAVGNLLEDGFVQINSLSSTEALMAHGEIKQMPVGQKTSAFFRRFFPLRKEMVVLFASSYRRYFKLALAHVNQADGNQDKWAREQLRPAVLVALYWIREWYILACDGENQSMRRLGSMDFVPAQTGSLSIPIALPPFPPPTSWRAPAWLFGIAPAFFGFGPLKEQHIPARDSEEKLGEAHTRLLLKGARRAFLWSLEAALETVRNEETAAAGAMRVEVVNRQGRGPNKRKGWEQRLKLYSAIQKALQADPGLQGIELCAALDKRHAPPLLDWTERGEWRNGLTWKEAWDDMGLRRKIRRVRQEAQKAN